MLKLIKLENNKYTLKGLEDNITITKEPYLKNYKVSITDDMGFDEVDYYPTLKAIQKQMSINMGI